jgi:hypothetical protein
MPNIICKCCKKKFKSKSDLCDYHQTKRLEKIETLSKEIEILNLEIEKIKIAGDIKLQAMQMHFDIEQEITYRELSKCEERLKFVNLNHETAMIRLRAKHRFDVVLSDLHNRSSGLFSYAIDGTVDVNGDLVPLRR